MKLKVTLNQGCNVIVNFTVFWQQTCPDDFWEISFLFFFSKSGENDCLTVDVWKPKRTNDAQTLTENTLTALFFSIASFITE